MKIGQQLFRRFFEVVFGINEPLSPEDAEFIITFCYILCPLAYIIDRLHKRLHKPSSLTNQENSK